MRIHVPLTLGSVGSGGRWYCAAAIGVRGNAPGAAAIGVRHSRKTRRHLLSAGIVLPELFSFPMGYYGKHPEGRVSILPAFPVNNLIYLHHVDLVHLEVRPD